MNQISKMKFLVGATAMIALSASVASAQAKKPTSTKRIPISKEGPGMRVDTVQTYRTDTVRVTGPTVYRTDTLRLTNTRFDTVMVQPIVPRLRFPNGVYFGLAGGVSAPNGAIYNPNSAGPSAQAQLGWQSGFFGLRGDLNWAKFGEDSQFSGRQADPDVLNWSADARLNLPFLTHLFGAQHRFGLYALGGFTYTMFKNLPMRVDPPAGTNLAVFTPGTNPWTKEGGWNAGGGATLSWGRTELFLESRAIQFDPTGAPASRQIPFMFGMNWYGSSR